MTDTTNQTPAQVPAKAPMASGAPIMAIIPRDNAEAARLAEAFVVAGMVPESIKGKTDQETKAKAMLVILKGMEIGIAPVTAMETIMVINGRTALWGDGASALVHRSGQLEYIKHEYTGMGDSLKCVVTVKRKGQGEAMSREFSMDDAKKAGLLGKGPWRLYPARMLFNRARAWCLRDGFADLLMGIGIAEELNDIAVEAKRGEKLDTSDLDPAPAQIETTVTPTVEESLTVKPEKVEQPQADLLGDPIEFDSKFKPCPKCAGSGRINDDLGDSECPTCQGSGDVPA